MRFFETGGPDVSQHLSATRETALRQVVVQNRLSRVLAFAHLTLDDVVNCRIAKRQALGFYKLSKEIDRRGEVVELERQWNPNRAG